MTRKVYQAENQVFRDDRRVLYMEKKAPTRVSLDGPALKVSVDEEADRMYPLSRISRMVIDKGISITTDALLACVGRGISICFTDPKSGVVARMLGVGHREQPLPRLLTEFLDRVDWRDRYADWKHAMYVRAFLRLLKNLGLSSARSVSPAMLGRLCQQWVASIADVDSAERTDRWLRELSYAWFVQLLADQGIGSTTEAGGDARLDLARDLGNIMRWELELHRIRWLEEKYENSEGGKNSCREISRKECVFWFESNIREVEHAGHRLLNRLEQWLIESGTE